MIARCFFILTFLLDEKSNKRIKENLKALRWSFVAPSIASRATTITAVIAQEAAAPNFPLPMHLKRCIYKLHLTENLINKFNRKG
jgi:hypothetical protein